MKKIKKIITSLLIAGIIINGTTLPAQAYTKQVNVGLLGVKKCDSDTADRSTWISDVRTYYLNSHENCNVSSYTDFNVTKMRLALFSSTYFTIHSHGYSDGSGVLCYDSNGHKSGAFTVSYLNGYSNDYFNNTKMCLLAACDTAKGSNNIAQTLHNKGVVSVVGYKESVDTAANKIWIKYFNMAFSVGYTVDDSITYADMMVLKEYNGKTGNTDSHKVYGDGAIYYGKGLK